MFNVRTALEDIHDAEARDDDDAWIPLPNPCAVHFYSPLGIMDRCTLAPGHAGKHENHDPRSPFFYDGHGHGTGERC